MLFSHSIEIFATNSVDEGSNNSTSSEMIQIELIKDNLDEIRFKKKIFDF